MVLDIGEVRSILDRVSLAIDIQSRVTLESSCNDLVAWAERMKRDYSPPLEQWIPTMQNYSDAGSACLRGDIGSMSDALSRSAAGIVGITAAIEEATAWTRNLP